MISFGIFELVMIAVMGVIFVPPHKLPELMRGLGRFLGQLRQYQRELRRMMNHFDAWQDHCKSEVHTTGTTVRRELERAAHEMAPADSIPLVVEEDVNNVDDTDDTDDTDQADKTVPDAANIQPPPKMSTEV